jgi:CheY-like chemotaxis protein
MNARYDLSPSSPPGAKLRILLMDANAERRALRKKVMGLRGAEVIAAADLVEAAAVWHRDRYDMVLIDIRQDHHGCIEWRNEIKKDAPQQFVAFLVGKPGYVSTDPSPSSYVAEEHGAQWGDALRRATQESCELLPQRNGFVEVGWRIAIARKMNGSHTLSPPVDNTPEISRGARSHQKHNHVDNFTSEESHEN